MIALCVVSLLVGLSSATLPTCSDLQKALLQESLLQKDLKIQEGDAKTIDGCYFENTLTFDKPEPDEIDIMYMVFSVVQADGSHIPKITVDDKSYELLYFDFTPLEALNEGASLTLSFTPDGYNTIQTDVVNIIVPLILSQNQEVSGFNADLNKDLSTLITMPKTGTQGGISMQWLQKLLSQTKPLRGSSQPEHEKNFLTDCAIVSSSVKEDFLNYFATRN